VPRTVASVGGSNRPSRLENLNASGHERNESIREGDSVVGGAYTLMMNSLPDDN
jgi:hypothetical protein